MNAGASEMLALYHVRIRTGSSALYVETPGDYDSSQDQLMRAIGPQTGQMLNSRTPSQQVPTIPELQTSFCSSGIWLTETARARDWRLVIMKQCSYKSAHSQAMSEQAELADYMDFQLGAPCELPGKLYFAMPDWTGRDFFTPYEAAT